MLKDFLQAISPFEAEPDKQQVQEPGPQGEAPEGFKPTVTGRIQAKTSPASFVSVNQEMIESIRTTTLSRKTPYTALLESAERLKGIIADETTRIKASYATISNEQRTPDAILRAIDSHITDVDTVLQSFRATTEAKGAENDEAANKAMVAYQSTIESSNAEIAGLNATITRLQHAVLDAQQGLANAQARQATGTEQLQLALLNFTSAAQTVKAELTDKRQVIATAIQGV